MPRIPTCPNCGADINGDCIRQENGTLFCDRFCIIQHHKQNLIEDIKINIKTIQENRKKIEGVWKGWVKKGLPIVCYIPAPPDFDEQLAKAKRSYKVFGILILLKQALLKEDAKSFATLEELMREEFDGFISDAKTSGQRKKNADICMDWIADITIAKSYFRV